MPGCCALYEPSLQRAGSAPDVALQPAAHGSVQRLLRAAVDISLLLTNFPSSLRMLLHRRGCRR